MRRKEKDKRVLRPGNGGQQNSRRKRIRKNNRQVFSTNKNNPRMRRKKSKSNNKLIFLMIFALVAFVIGAGIGVSLSFDDGDDGPKYVDVTKEMTHNLNETNPAYIYDSDVDNVDYNENATSQFDIDYQSYEEDLSSQYENLDQSYSEDVSYQQDYAELYLINQNKSATNNLEQLYDKLYE